MVFYKGVTGYGMTESFESSVLADLRNGKDGAKYNVLSTLAKFVLNDIEVSPRLQRVANLIITRSLLENKLPQKKNGRRKDRTGIDGELVASKYKELMDSGSSYADAASTLAAEFHKDERQIMRIVKENKEIVAAKKLFLNLSEHFPNNEATKQLNGLANLLVSLMDELKEHQRKRIDPKANLVAYREQIAQLDKQIMAVASNELSTDINL